MSLALALNGITDLKIAGDYYRPGTFSIRHSSCWAWADRWHNCFLKQESSGGGLNLDFGGRVWLDVWIADGYGGFTRGGYLEEVEHQYHFSLPAGGSDTIIVKTLAVKPAVYAGGVRVDGIKSPPNQWTDITQGWRDDGFTVGTVHISFAESFVWNGAVVTLVNWRARGIGNENGGLTATVGCALTNDIRWGYLGEP